MTATMKRREFITLLGSAAAWPLAAGAQQAERMRKVGLLMGRESGPDARAHVKVLRQRLGELGWSEDRNIRIDVVWGAGDADHVRADAAELIRESPDVIVTNGPVPTTEAGKATPAIPIVFVQVPDPVDLGIVASLARPVGFLRTITALELSSGVKATPAGVRHAAEVERAIDDFAREPNGGLIVLPSQIATNHRELIIALAARHRLPAIYPWRYFPESGGLSSYGIDTVDMFRRAASYVDRILRGEKPADLPVQAPTKYELVINLKTAKALGLEVPSTLLARADEVIE
jgi:ABC-type uncharacterized transport system substrate-binding protein